MTRLQAGRLLGLAGLAALLPFVVPATTVEAGAVVRLGVPAFGGTVPWAAAIGDGRVRPLDALSAQATDYFQTEAQARGLFGLSLRLGALSTGYEYNWSDEAPGIAEGKSGEGRFTITPGGGEPIGGDDGPPPDDPDSLFLSWQFEPQTTSRIPLSVAGWEFVYDQDPDLRGTETRLIFHLPSGILWLGLEWIDAAGLSCGIFDRLGTLQEPEDTVTFRSDPNFDLTQIVRIQITVATFNGAAILEPSPTGTAGPWAAFGSLRVENLPPVPEPPSWLLFGGLGILAFLLHRPGNPAKRKAAIAPI